MKERCQTNQYPLSHLHGQRERVGLFCFELGTPSCFLICLLWGGGCLTYVCAHHSILEAHDLSGFTGSQRDENSASGWNMPWVPSTLHLDDIQMMLWTLEMMLEGEMAIANGIYWVYFTCEEEVGFGDPRERNTRVWMCPSHTQSYVGALTPIEMVFEDRNYGRQFETEYILMEEPDSLRRLKDPPHLCSLPSYPLCILTLFPLFPSRPPSCFCVEGHQNPALLTLWPGLPASTNCKKINILSYPVHRRLFCV